MKMDMPQEELHRLFAYRDDGQLIWLPRPVDDFHDKGRWVAWHKMYCGKPAGTLSSNGYCHIGIRCRVTGNLRKFLAHRLIWAFHYGEADITIDHRNRNRSDNRIENLREATSAQQLRNQDRHDHILRGIRYEADREKWKATINKDNRTRTIGRFNCQTAAILAVRKRSLIEFGDFA